jgi:glucose-6-phosphate 1-dehydrogenase
LMPEKFAIFGVDVKPIEVETLPKHLLDGVNQFSRQGKAKAELWKAFTSHIVGYQAGDFNDVATFEALAKAMNAQDKF